MTPHTSFFTSSRGLAVLLLGALPAALWIPATLAQGSPAQGAPAPAPKADVLGPKPQAGDPDAPGAPIADRDTFNAKPREVRPAPDLAQIGVPRTNYPIPNGALFVSPAGDANASGSDKNRPTTLVHAVETAPVGATIVLRGGVYRGVSDLKVPHQMTLQAAPNEEVWIKGSEVVSGFTRNAAPAAAPDAALQWSVSWDKKLTHPNQNDIDKNNPLAVDTDMVFLGGKSLKQVGAPAEVTAGTFCVDSAAKTLILGDDPGGKLVEASVAVRGFDIRDKVCIGTIIRGLGFAHFAEFAIEDLSPGQLFENNTFAWNAVRGMRLNGADSIVRGNNFIANGLSGMSGFFNDRLLFERNRVAFNNIEGFRATWSAAGVKFARLRDATFRNNILENNQAAAMWFDISCINVNVVGNTVRSNKGLGIFYELCQGGIVAFNLCQDNGVGLMLSDTSDLRAWNNTFVDNSKAVTLKDTKRVNDATKNEGIYSSQARAADIAAGVTWITTNNEFKNNLFVGGRGPKDVLFEAGNAPEGKTGRDMVASMDFNAYARTRPGFPANLVRWNGGGNQLAEYDSLGALREAQTGIETNAVLLEGAPLFADAAQRDYHLAPKSALRNAGTPLPADIRAVAIAAGIPLDAASVPRGAFGTK